MRTIPLYDENAYAREFKARVISCQESISEGVTYYEIILGETLFFPEQGGQTSDRGRLNDVEVFDVQIKDQVIYHYCREPIAPGTLVKGLIDWDHRFNNMQQHTGEHIFTGLAHNRYGAENVGFHLSDNTVTLDLDIELTEEQVAGLELEANRVIAENLPIYCFYPEEDVLEITDYRSKKEIEGPVRLVKIGDVDICACCAPHVKTTSEVGILKVLSAGKYKGGMRIYILCGLRALEDYRIKQNLLKTTYQTLNCSQEELAQKAAGILEENRQLRYEIGQIKEKALFERIDGISSELEDVTIFASDLDSKAMREGVNRLVEVHKGLCSIFSGDDENGYSFVMGSKSRDCKAIASGLRELLSARCGGSKQMISGSVTATETQIRNTI